MFELPSVDLDAVIQAVQSAAPAFDWAKAHWTTLILSGEIVGAMLAIKAGFYRKGFCWVLAALVTLWMGVL